MKLCLNGNCSAPWIVKELQSDGHDVTVATEPEYVPERRERDKEIQRKAQEDGRVTVTGNISDWCRREMNAVRTGGCMLVREHGGPPEKSVNEYKLWQIREQVRQKGNELENGAMTMCSRDERTGEAIVREVNSRQSIRGWRDVEEQARNADVVRKGGQKVKPVVRPGEAIGKEKSARDGHGWKR